MAAVYLHHLPQLMGQAGLEVGALGSQAYHTVASVVVSPPVGVDKCARARHKQLGFLCHLTCTLTDA